MATLLSAGNNFSGNWYTMTDNTVPRSSGYLSINVDRYSETFTAPSTSNAAVGCAFMIDSCAAPPGIGTWTLTLQEYNGGGWSDVETGSFDFDTNPISIMDQFFYIALDSPYTFTTMTSGYYRWKLRSDSLQSANWVRQSATSTSNFCYICFDDRTTTISANDTLFVVDAGTKIDANVTLGNGTTGSGWVWTHALYVLTGGDLDFDAGGSYTVTLEGSVFIDGGGKLGTGTALSSSVTGTFEFSMSGYSNGDFYVYINRGGACNLTGATRTIQTNYQSGSGTTASPMLTSSDIGLAVNDFIIVTATEAYEESEEKYIKSGSHVSGWVLSDTAGGAESGLANTHTGDAYVLSLTRNIVIKTDDSAKGFRVDDVKWADDQMATNHMDYSQWAYIQLINIYYSRFREANRTGCSFYNLTYSSQRLCQDLSGLMPITNQYNIYARSLIQTSSGEMCLMNSKFRTENDSFYVIAGVGMLRIQSSDNTFNRCNFLDGNYGNSSQGAAVYMTSAFRYNFNNCNFDLIQRQNLLFFNELSDLRLNSCSFGELKESTYIVYVLSNDNNYYWEAIFQNCALNYASQIGYHLDYGISGAYVGFHNLDETTNEHIRYTRTGNITSSGAGLTETVTRTIGHLSLCFQPEEITYGLVWEFKIPAPANSAIGILGFAYENTEFYGDADSSLFIELFLPGSTIADDSLVFDAPAANTWDVWSLSSNYTGAVSALATVKITAKADDPGAKCYIADIWNGTNEITNLNTWVDAYPCPILMENFAGAASVWAVLQEGNALEGTMGQAQVNALSVKKFLALK